MLKILAYTATGVLLLALIGAAIAGHSTDSRVALSSKDTGARGARGSQPGPPDTQLIGSTLVLYHSDHTRLYLDAIDRMAETGFNAVQIVTPIFQADGASPKVRVEVGPGRGPSDKDIAEVLNHARIRGMYTMLMPQVNFTTPRGNEWRGKLQPEHWAPWWQSYTRAIDRFLQIAQDNRVDLFAVGCELLTTHKPEHQARWRELIAHCRERFDGRLTYSTTWDTYHKITLWDDLDAVGISGYWDLTTLAKDRENPSAQELKARWLEIRQRVLSFAQSTGKPVLLTEVGYPSLPWALKDPWNYVNSDSDAPDHDAQAAGYAAFIAAWGRTITPMNSTTPGDPRALGVFFHKWDPYHFGGPKDKGYGVLGKPAHQSLKKWLLSDFETLSP